MRITFVIFFKVLVLGADDDALHVEQNQPSHIGECVHRNPREGPGKGLAHQRRGTGWMYRPDSTGCFSLLETLKHNLNVAGKV